MPDIELLLKLLTQFAWLGNWLFFALAFIESAPFVGVFMPGATLISIGGFLASQGILSTWDIILFASIGAIIGDFFSYSMGRWGGKWVKDKKIINKSFLGMGENFFKKYGDRSIFLGRFFGPIRAVIPFVAGLSRMKQVPFIFWNVISGILWAILNVFLGYFSGTLLVTIFKKWSGNINFVIILFFIILFIYWIIKTKDTTFKKSFRLKSIIFVKKLNSYGWFKKLSDYYMLIPYFLKNSKHAPEKLLGGFIIFSFLTIAYILVLIFDIF